MGCASSKPSSGSKGGKTGKVKDQTREVNQTKHQTENVKSQPKTKQSSAEANRQALLINDELFTQIARDQPAVIDYIFVKVRNDLNAELTHSHKKGNLADVALAASASNDNDDLIMDVSSRAIQLIQSGKCRSTYQHLLDSLNESKFLCLKQNHKTRICELTVDTIRECLNSINSGRTDHDLMDFINQKQITSNSSTAMTPVTSPDQVPEWQKSGVPLTRIQANHIARILFLSSRARPVLHSSPTAKDAYIVNKQIDGTNTEVTLTQNEIDDILWTFKEANAIVKSSTTPKVSFNEDPLTPPHETPRRQPDTKKQSALRNLGAELDEVAITRQQELADELREVEGEEYRVVTSTVRVAQRQTTIEENELGQIIIEEKTTITEFDEPATITVESYNQLDGPTIEEYITEVIPNITEQQFIETSKENDAPDNEDSKDLTSEITNTSSTEQPEDDGTLDNVLKQSLLDDRFYNNDSFKTANPLNTNKAESDSAATTIQANYKGHVVAKAALKEKQEAAAAPEVDTDVNQEAAAAEVGPSSSAGENKESSGEKETTNAAPKE